jgi:hypothetical protein
MENAKILAVSVRPPSCGSTLKQCCGFALVSMRIRNPDPAYYVNADLNPDPDPGSQTNPDPDPGQT